MIPSESSFVITFFRTTSFTRRLKVFRATAFPYFFETAHPNRTGWSSHSSGEQNRIHNGSWLKVFAELIWAHCDLPLIFQSVERLRAGGEEWFSSSLFIWSPHNERQEIDYALRRLRPLSRRRFKTLRPALVAIRDVNPCLRERLRLLGWNVRFVDMSTSYVPRNARKNYKFIY